MQKENLVLIGGGDQCLITLDMLEEYFSYRIIGIIDSKDRVGQSILGYPIIGTDDELLDISKECSNFLITVGQIESASVRLRIFKQLKEINASLPIIIHPLAHVSKHATLGEGTVVFAYNIIDTGVTIGKNCIINHGSIIGHNAIIGNHCHISTNCSIAKCVIKDECFVGGNSWINNGVYLPQGTVIGSASNVIKGLDQPGIYAGNPAKMLRPL